MKRGGELKRTPLARIGRRAKKDAPARAEVIRIVRERDLICKFGFYADSHVMNAAGTCSGRLDVHEIVPRSVWPDSKLHAEGCALLCRKHHAWLDDNRKVAEQIGLYSRVKP